MGVSVMGVCLVVSHPKRQRVQYLAGQTRDLIEESVELPTLANKNLTITRRGNRSRTWSVHEDRHFADNGTIGERGDHLAAAGYVGGAADDGLLHYRLSMKQCQAWLPFANNAKVPA